MMKFLVWEGVWYGVWVNVVVFGFIDIEMILVIWEDIWEKIIKEIFFCCFGKLEEIVWVVVFLFFFVVSSYVIGEVLWVNGVYYI